jgi:hypothetical protein
MNKAIIQTLAATGATLAVGLTTTTPAHAEPPPAALRGSYAPGGDCTKEPRFTLGEALTVHAAGKTTKVAPLDSCKACVAGPDYDGIEVWVAQLGPDGMTREPTLRFNADEKRGVVAIDKAGAQGFSPAMRALAMASPLKRCAK